MPRTGEFLVFDTHPIQYRSPVFRKLAHLCPFEVAYFSDSFKGDRWWFHEVGQAKAEAWQVELRTGFPNTTLNTDPLSFLEKLRTLAQFLRTRKPKAVILYGWYLSEHWMLWALCTAWRIPLLFIGETHAQGNSSWRRVLKKILHPLFFSQVTQVISIGSKTASFYRSLNIEEKKIIEAKYCVDIQFFESTREEKSQVRNRLRAQLNIPDEDFVALFVGRLFERKRPTDMVALHQKFMANPHYHTLMAGQGELAETLKKTTVPLPRFQLLGFQNQKQVRDLYLAADLLIVPSEYETWGLVINEAFATGLPALVTHTCGAAEDLVRPGSTGYVYPMGDTEAASQFIQKLIHDPKLRYTLGLNAKRLVASDYTVDQFAHSMNFALRRAAAV